MSKHRHERCCSSSPMYAAGDFSSMGYGGAGYSQGISGGSGYAGSGIRWIYALLILIVVVLQFGKKNKKVLISNDGDCGGETVSAAGLFGDNQLIDNSVLFIIVVFLLILCAGCWSGGTSNYGAAGQVGRGFGF